MDIPYEVWLFNGDRKYIGKYKSYKCANRKLRELRRKGVKGDILICPAWYIVD
jgi:hypothetical protein